MRKELLCSGALFVRESSLKQIEAGEKWLQRATT